MAIEKDKEIEKALSKDTVEENSSENLIRENLQLPEGETNGEHEPSALESLVARAAEDTPAPEKGGKKDKFQIFSKKMLAAYAVIFAAGLINTLGVGILLSPNEVLDGGLSGASVLMSWLSGLPAGYFIFGFNMPFFIFGTKKMGPKFICCSIAAVISYAFWMLMLAGKFTLIDQIDMSNLAGYDAAALATPILAAVFGGFLSGIGSGLVIRMGGSLDGVEIMAMVFAKKLGISVGQFDMFFNIVLMSAAAFILGKFNIALLSIMAYFIGIQSLDGIVDGLDRAKGAIIITTRGAEVAAMLSERMKRGVTMLEGSGFYSKEHKSVLYFVVNRFEIARLKNNVFEADPRAFISIMDISETVGSSYKSSFPASFKK